jgi:hypothetical protein
MDEYDLIQRELAGDAKQVAAMRCVTRKSMLAKLAAAALLCTLFAALALYTPVLDVDSTLSAFTLAMAPSGEGHAAAPTEGEATLLASTQAAPSSSFSRNTVEIEVLAPPPAPPEDVAAENAVAEDATDDATETIIDLDLVNDMADEILAQLITDDMSQRKKAAAIFDWVVENMKYSSKTNPRDLAVAAYTCYTEGVGDCYVFFAGYHILLNRAGIKNERNNRIEGLTEHYWNVVKIGGKWYHSDACTNGTIPAEERFLFTDTQAKSFSERMRDNGGRDHEAYKYNKSATPDVVD